jgi:predicted esterase
MSRLLAIVAAVMLLGGAVVGILALGSASGSRRRPQAPLAPTLAAVDDPSLSPIYDIPRLDKIKVDGDPAGWGSHGLKVNALASTSGKVQPKSDIDAKLRLAWNDRGLLALITVHDDIPYEDANPAGGDSIELFISSGPGQSSRPPDIIRCAIGPGVDPNHPDLRTRLFDQRRDPQLRKVPAHISVARTRIEGGYVIEALIPWDNFALKPIIGREIGFQIIVNDADAYSQATHLVWYPSTDAARDPTKMQRLRLAASTTSTGVNVAAYGDYPRFHRTRISIISADASLANKLVEVVPRPAPGPARTTAPAATSEPSPTDPDDPDAEPVPPPRPSRALVTGKLEPDFVRPELASATLSLPIPPRDTGYGLLDVLIDGQRVGFVDLPTPGYAATWLMPYEDFAFTPCVFSTRAFPEGDFENASFVEDLIGPYESRVTFYDAQFNRVITADKPGRYGAVVEVRTDDGRVFKRYKTLFREPQDFSWRNTDIPITVKFPKEMGITAAALKLQQKAVSDYYKQLLEAEGINRGDGQTAVLLAGLYETKVAPTTKALQRNSPQAMDRAWWAGLKRKLGEPVLPHLVFLPHGCGANNTDGRWKVEDGRDPRLPATDPRLPPPAPRYPLVLFLHGKGERGEHLDQVKDSGLPARLEYDRTFRCQFPAIVVAPQCAPSDWWSSYELSALLDDIQSRYPVDPDRIYVTGMSMGGYATWALATEFPARFAAIAPLCGGGDPGDAEPLAHLPVWAFHGARDIVVPPSESADMIDALRALGNGDAKLTLLPDTGHDAWTEAYASPQLYAWLFSHRRSEAAPVASQLLAGSAPTTAPAH